MAEITCTDSRSHFGGADAVHTLYGAKLNLRNALVVGISQSGAGPDINEVLDTCRRRGAFTLGITNEARSPITKVVGRALFVHSGKERSVAATKTYTGQLMLLYLLSWASSARQMPGESSLSVSRTPPPGLPPCVRPRVEELWIVLSLHANHAPSSSDAD